MPYNRSFFPAPTAVAPGRTIVIAWSGMPFFVLQVRTGGEEKFRRQAEKVLTPERGELFWPRRSLRVRRAGVWRETVAPIFPGYLFLRADHLSTGLFRELKSLPGFTRFLRDNSEVEPLGERDLQILQHFLSFGEVVHPSRVRFDAERRIQVIDGPLKALEGRIVRVDRRKRRARVRLELYENSFLIDFGFENIAPTNS
jgi:transcriptional antiterminator NusG